MDSVPRVQHTSAQTGSTRQQKFSVVVAIPPAYRRPHYPRGPGGTHILKVMRHLSGFPVRGPDIHTVA